MTRLKVWINGKMVDIDNAKISVFDRGYLYGDGVFETMRSYAGVVFRIEEHLERLFRAFTVMRMKPPYAKNQVKDAVYRCLKTNGIKSGYIRVNVTRGEGRFGIDFKDEFEPKAVIVTKEFGEYPAGIYTRGINARVVDMRQNEYSPVSGIKSLNFLNYILSRFNARREGADEAILLNTKGYLAEAATSNVFLVKRGRLITPSAESGILPGITRAVIIEIAKALKIKVRERLVKRRELSDADEVFLTNSLVEVLPVTRLGSRKIGDGKVGDVTKLLRISYQKQVIREVLF